MSLDPLTIASSQNFCSLATLSCAGLQILVPKAGGKRRRGLAPTSERNNGSTELEDENAPRELWDSFAIEPKSIKGEWERCEPAGWSDRFRSPIRKCRHVWSYNPGTL